MCHDLVHRHLRIPLINRSILIFKRKFSGYILIHHIRCVPERFSRYLACSVAGSFGRYNTLMQFQSLFIQTFLLQFEKIRRIAVTVLRCNSFFIPQIQFLCKTVIHATPLVPLRNKLLKRFIVFPILHNPFHTDRTEHHPDCQKSKFQHRCNLHCHKGSCQHPRCNKRCSFEKFSSVCLARRISFLYTDSRKKCHNVPLLFFHNKCTSPIINQSIDFFYHFRAK